MEESNKPVMFEYGLRTVLVICVCKYFFTVQRAVENGAIAPGPDNIIFFTEACTKLTKSGVTVVLNFHSC